MASKKFPLLIFVFVLLVLIAGIGTVAYNREQKKIQLINQTANPTPTNTVNDTSNQQLDQDAQNVDQSLNSLDSDLNNVNSSMNDQPTNLQ